MNDDLFFIPLIERALQQRNLKTALADAFHEIRRKGAQKKYTEGFKNFELFMDCVYSRHDTVVTDYVREMMIELATRTFKGTEQEKKMLKKIICLRTDWMVEYLTIRRQEDRGNLLRVSFPEIAVMSEKYPARYVSFPKGPGCQRFDDILPDNYKLKLLNTGWTLWEGRLTAKDLIKSEVLKDQNLGLAAGLVPPTREIDLLDNGDLILRTYAEDKNGRIEIELTR